MTRSKKLLSLLVVLVVLVGAIIVVTKLVPEEDETSADEDTGVSVLSLDSDSISELSWDYEGEQILLNLQDGQWLYEDAACPIDQEYPSAMITTLSNITASKVIEDVEDFSQYGLEEPACAVLITADTTTQLLIGNETSIGGERYLSIGDGNVYLVDSSILDSFSYGLYDIIEMESIPAISNVSSLVADGSSQRLELVYLEDSALAYTDEYVWFLKNNQSYLPLSTNAVSSYLEAITGLSWQSCVDYAASAEGLASYGLDTPAVTVTVNYTENAPVETNTTGADGNALYGDQEAVASFALEIGDTSGGSCYARIAGSRMVYLIDASIRDTLLYTTYADLQPDEVLLMDWDTVTGMDISLDGATYHIGKAAQEATDEDGNVTEKTVYLLDGEEIEMTDVLEDLTAMVSTGFSGGIAPESGAEISFVFYRNTESFPQVELSFYQYDSSSCLVRLNGETRLLVAREDVASVVETVKALVLD